MELKAPSDLYNAWFTYPEGSCGQEVDYLFMNRLKEALPQDYIIPDPRIMEALVQDQN
ncbi:hypothetical protein J2Z69_003202 [Paenibacillus shirakamiensis]|uniref:Uncharacterized protein n=1 Tax=Paenibacillus shirakamiensis TaxID=1265935 RepID=A0ABS4JKB6_9BACL|nr:hypothetical protein [Paenibacillus shirakamiensis]MBP2002145.1 hypothetical protein [Paenibacillus shirakamiensis]